MKRLGQIREEYDTITEKVESESNRLAMLVRAGLFDPKKLPMLKRALAKDVKDMTPAERKILIELLDSLMSEVLQSQQVYNKVKQNVMVKEVEESLYESSSKAFDGYLSKADPRFSKMPSERQIPTIIILKRKAIRIYPDNQKVALYYSQALDKYVTIPFGAMEGGSVNESVEDQRTKANRLTTELPTNTNTPSPEAKPKVKPEAKPKQAKRREDLYTRKLNTKFGVNRAIVAMRKDDSMDAPTRIGTTAGLQLRQKVTSMMAKRNKPAVAPKKNVSTVPALSESKGRIAKSKFYEKRNQQIDEAIPLALAVGAGIAARAIASKALASKAVDVGSKVASGAARIARNTATGAGRLARKVGKGTAGAAGALVGALAGSGAPEERTFSEPKELSPKALEKNRPKSQQIRTAVKPKEIKLKNSSNSSNSSNSNVMESLYSMRSNEEKRLVIADESILINTITAKKIIGVYESLNRNNQEKVNSILNESVGSFKKFANFAAKQ